MDRSRPEGLRWIANRQQRPIGAQLTGLYLSQLGGPGEQEVISPTPNGEGRVEAQDQVFSTRLKRDLLDACIKLAGGDGQDHPLRPIGGSDSGVGGASSIFGHVRLFRGRGKPEDRAGVIFLLGGDQSVRGLHVRERDECSASLDTLRFACRHRLILGLQRFSLQSFLMNGDENSDDPRDGGDANQCARESHLPATSRSFRSRFRFRFGRRMERLFGTSRFGGSLNLHRAKP
jgi:hypothetical protein